MDWVRILAYIAGTVDQELLLRNEYRGTSAVEAASVVMRTRRSFRAITRLVLRTPGPGRG